MGEGCDEATGVAELTGLAPGVAELAAGEVAPTVAEGAELAVGEAFAATAGLTPGVGEAIATIGKVPSFTLSLRVLGLLPLWA